MSKILGEVGLRALMWGGARPIGERNNGSDACAVGSPASIGDCLIPKGLIATFLLRESWRAILSSVNEMLLM